MQVIPKSEGAQWGHASSRLTLDRKREGPVEYRVLGPIEVVEGGSPIDLGSRKQRALLALLLLNANRVVALDTLVTQLWPDQPPARATASLQAYIANLRRVLEPDRPARRPPAVLVTRPPGYLLRATDEQVDAARFESSLTAARAALDTGDADGARTLLSGALLLWRGEPVGELGHDSFPAGHAALALPRLDAELSARPQPPAMSGAFGGTENRNAPQNDDGAALVGRREQLERLEELWAATLRGRGGVALVAGEPGIGKTRLVEELTAGATRDGGRVGWGRCHEQQGAPAYWPWLQVLAQLEDTAASASFTSIEAEAPVSDALLPEAARFPFYDAIARRLRARAGRGPIVVVIEDLHWSDVASLGVLG